MGMSWQKSSPVVLLVDDDPVLLQSLKGALDRAGLATLTAANAQGAELALAASKPQVIVLDVMMPGEDGFSFLHRLKESQELQDIPVVLLTAKDEEKDLLEGWQKGADAYLTKPFLSEEVVLLVKGILKDRGASAL